MLILTSPAKTQDFESPYTDSTRTAPAFLPQAQEIMKILRTLSVKQLMTLMEISEELAQLNHDRFARWGGLSQGPRVRPAIFAYRGDIYREMDVSQYSPVQFAYLQRSLRILSGLYGVLRPFDMMEAYRLEMGTPLSVKPHTNLYDFWGDSLTRFVRDDVVQNGHTMVVNLASEEYANAIQFAELGVSVKHIIFKQRMGSVVKTYGILAKRARGMMINHLVRRCSEKLADIREFTVGGYRLTGETDDTLEFTSG